MARDLTRFERSQIRMLVTQECCNYFDYYKICLLTDRPCPMLSTTKTAPMRGWFKEAVLPTHKELETRLKGSPVTRKLCAACKKAFVPLSNRQVYCGDLCQQRGNRDKRRVRMDRMRENRG